MQGRQERKRGCKLEERQKMLRSTLSNGDVTRYNTKKMKWENMREHLHKALKTKTKKPNLDVAEYMEQVKGFK